MKMAPVLRELSKHGEFECYLVHTGQHYDDSMSQVFFQELKMPQPDFNLKVGSGSHAVQTAEIMRRFEEVCDSIKPNLVIVGGDVNSTLACSLTAAKLQIPVAHIESGLRSFDRSLPEEINRILTDAVSDFLFTTEESGNQDLRREGVSEEKIHFVGNTMIDSLVHCYDLLDRPPLNGPLAALNAGHTSLQPFIVPPTLTIQPSYRKCSASETAPLFFVAHPRTRDRLRRVKAGDRLIDINDGIPTIQSSIIYLLPSLPYLDFLCMMANCKAVLTDSGGIQEETTFLGIPCLTMRNNTERPITVEVGTNQIVGLERDTIILCLSSVMDGKWKDAATPPLWDGHSAERVVAVLRTRYGLS